MRRGAKRSTNKSVGCNGRESYKLRGVPCGCSRGAWFCRGDTDGDTKGVTDADTGGDSAIMGAREISEAPELAADTGRVSVRLPVDVAISERAGDDPAAETGEYPSPRDLNVQAPLPAPDGAGAEAGRSSST